jgi:hypothetical protein
VIGIAQLSWRTLGVIVVCVVFYGTLGWVILRAYRWLRRLAEASQSRALEGLKVHSGPAPGLVSVVFHTYYGFIAFVIQTEHRFWPTPEDARETLRRLDRFNMRWGMFAYGALVIPLLSCGNYLAQKRSIQRQETALIV